MGLGDWVMATVEARRVNERTGRPVVFTNPHGRVFWQRDIFANNPRISKDIDGSEPIINCPGVRPYIKDKGVDRWYWKTWDIEPGEIYLTVDEIISGLAAHGKVMIEPHVKLKGGNKEWPFRRFQDVVDAMPDVQFLQAVKPGGVPLLGVQTVETSNFRQALALLANARAFVGCEGALHHAAASLKTPAVVLWSEFISPTFTGYGEQVNIRHAETVCGSRLPCASCRESMEAITPHEVVVALRGLL